MLLLEGIDPLSSCVVSFIPTQSLANTGGAFHRTMLYIGPGKRGMRTVCVVAFCSAMSGCALSGLTGPVAGKLSDDSEVSSAPTARVGGDGTFAVTFPEGLTCSGTYDPLRVDRNFSFPVACADGRTGKSMLVLRDVGRSGTAVVTLNDGTIGRFVFGNLKYEQAFNEMGGPQLTHVHDVDLHEPDWTRTPQ